MSPHNDRAEEPWRVELPVLRRADTTECCDSMRRRIKQPDTATVPDWPTARSSPRRCAKEPDRGAGIIEIEMPRRSIEHVALADGTCRGLPAVTAPTEDSGAAAREYSLLRTQSPTCGN